MKVIHSFQEIIVPSYRLLEWCCLMAFSFCHRRAALPPPPLVKWRVLQDSKWVRNAPKPIFFFFFWCSGVSVQTAGNAFASCIFSSRVAAATHSFKQTSRKKSRNCWKKNCLIATILTVPLMRLSSPFLLRSRYLEKRVERVTRAWWCTSESPPGAPWLLAMATG